MRVITSLSGLLVVMFVMTACTPKPGTPQWCDYMDQKAKGDWSANEATDYAKHCIFK